jgi:Flp pilus assembly protein TadG
MQSIRVKRRVGPTTPRHGTAATEFAIILPVFLLLAIASMDFGRIAYYAEVVSNSARAGAEVGATRRFTADTRSAWETHVRDTATSEMQNLSDFDEAKLEWNLSTTSDADGVVCVTVDLAYPFTTIVAWPLLPTQVRLHKTVQFRQFR